MRRRLYFGVALAMALILVAGGFLLNHSVGAQDGAKKADPEKKSDDDLFDILRKKFEKPDAPPVALPTPTAQVPAIAPMEPSKGEAKPPIIPPPMVPQPIAPPTTVPAGAHSPLLPLPTQPLPTKSADMALPQPTSGTLPLPTQGAPKPDALPQPVPQPTPPLVTPPAPADLKPLPPQPKLDVKPPIVEYPLPTFPGSQAPVIDPLARTPMPMPPINEPIKLKGSAWSLYVEMVNGQTVVTATVNKKHEFKITCQHLDLQTVAGAMKARGKVQITGDAFNGSCDQLSLPLHEDRLVLEGTAEVRIQKVTTNVSDAKPAAFELKGDKLDLRIGELQSSAFLETNWRKTSGDASEIKAMPVSMKRSETGKEWTQYGKLRSMKSDENNVWCLESSRGEVIAYVMAREGGSLDPYVGRTIAVFGAREGDRAGHPLVRVTHIAMP